MTTTHRERCLEVPTGDWTQQAGPEDARVEKHVASTAVRMPSVKMHVRSARGQVGR